MQKPEMGHNEHAASTSNRLPRLEESDIQASLSDILDTDVPGPNIGTASDMSIQNGRGSPHMEGDEDMMDHLTSDPSFNDPWPNDGRSNSTHVQRARSTRRQQSAQI